jgi:protein pelota
MKSSFDLKHNTGRITPENTDDLDVLAKIVKEGDIVTAKTLRAIEIRRGEEKVKAGKRFYTLTIQVEKISLDNILKLGGKIIEGPEEVERGYHTLEIEPGTFATIQHRWKSWEIDWIKSMQVKVENILVCILDEREADLYSLRTRYIHLLHLSSESSGKMYESRRETEYLNNVLKELERKSERFRKIIIAGPGFARDNLNNLMKQRAKDILNKVKTDFTYQTGELGLKELLKKGLVESLVKESRISKETYLVETLLASLNDNKAVAGLEKTKEALVNGMVDTLLISDSKIREYESVLDSAENLKAKIMIISSNHSSGEQLLGLGGLAALLRY